MAKSIKCGALWIKENQYGKYMGGVIELNGQKTNITIFKNKYKKEDKQPDYVINTFVDEAESPAKVIENNNEQANLEDLKNIF